MNHLDHPLSTHFNRFRERKVGQWTLAYAAVAWGTLQLLDFLANHFAWQPWIVRATTIFLIANVLTVVVLAWYHGERGPQRVSATEAALLAITLSCALGGGWVMARTKTSAADPAPTATSDISASSIAVLPFINHGAPENQYFSDGITEEILNAIARIPGLQVAARTSSFSFRGDSAQGDVARQLHVANLLTGGVQHFGNHVRVTTQINDTRTNKVIWSGQFDSNMSDVFALEDSISKAIAQHLQKTLAVGTVLAAGGTQSDSAHNLYLHGLDQWSKRTVASLHQSVTYFEDAVKADPAYAAAHAGLALALAVIPNYDLTENYAADFSRGKIEAHRALALDSMSDDAYAALSEIAQYGDDNMAQAERYAQKALSINPNSATAHQWLAESLWAEGKLDEALAEMDRALTLDRLSPVMHTLRAYILDSQGKLAPALAEVQKALIIDSTFNGAITGGLNITLDMKRYDLTRQFLAKLVQPNQVWMEDTVINGITDSTKRPALFRLLASLHKSDARNGIYLAEVAGDRDYAIDLARKAAARHDPPWFYWSLMSQSSMKGLREDPRFPGSIGWPRK